MTYDTVYAKKAHAVETLTETKDADGAWRAWSYSIK